MRFWKKASSAATATGNNPTLTTLYLKGFGVGHGGCSGYAYGADVGLTVNALDSNGFVTDNLPFIEEVQSGKEPKSREALVDRILAIAQRRKDLTGRLVGIIGKVWDSDQNETPIIWAPSNEKPAIEVPNTKFVTDITSRYVPAKLVDNAVCGGYDGHFNCDLSVKTDNKLKKNLLDHVKKGFEGVMLKASCEELTHGLINRMCMLPITINFARARVYNKTGYAEVVWNPTMIVPSFPRVATDDEVHRTTRRQREEFVSSYRSGC